jgi:N-acetylglucosaminyl-diphospho-decaprenol L-rhamnosyltransferase
VPLSTLIVSFCAKDRLKACLASLCASDVEAVVVDNGSSDGSAEMVRREFASVRLIAWPENRGFAKAVNEAARQAQGEMLLLLNPDAIVDPAVLSCMPGALRSLPDASAVGFRQVDEGGRYQLTIGPPPSLWLELVRRCVQRRLDAGDERLGRWLDRALSRPRRVPWAAGSALLVWRSAFERVGGFDERFFLYFEDIDFCLRLGREVGPVYYDPSLTVLHVRGESARSAPELARQAYRDSQLYYWNKHRGPFWRAVVRAYQRLAGLS